MKVDEYLLEQVKVELGLSEERSFHIFPKDLNSADINHMVMRNKAKIDEYCKNLDCEVLTTKVIGNNKLFTMQEVERFAKFEGDLKDISELTRVGNYFVIVNYGKLTKKVTGVSVIVYKPHNRKLDICPLFFSTL